jgi:uncharacterized protein YyaL (SSP411 family)
VPLTNAEIQAAWRERRNTLAKSAEALHEAIKRAAERDELAAHVASERAETTLHNLAEHFENTEQKTEQGKVERTEEGP